MLEPDFDKIAEQKEAAQERHYSDPLQQLALQVLGRPAETSDYIGLQNRVLLQLAAEEIERLRFANSEIASGYNRMMRYDSEATAEILRLKKQRLTLALTLRSLMKATGARMKRKGGK